jgi:hypothetical protein
MCRRHKALLVLFRYYWNDKHKSHKVELLFLSYFFLLYKAIIIAWRTTWFVLSRLHLASTCITDRYPIYFSEELGAPRGRLIRLILFTKLSREASRHRHPARNRDNQRDVHVAVRLISYQPTYHTGSRYRLVDIDIFVSANDTNHVSTGSPFPP